MGKGEKALLAVVGEPRYNNGVPSARLGTEWGRVRWQGG